MQNALINIAGQLEDADLVDSRFSFGPFVKFLKERAKFEKTMKVKFLQFVIGHFEERLAGKPAVTLEEVNQYEDLLELIYTTIFPVIADEHANLWALSTPLKPHIFYGTELFYAILWDEKTGQIRNAAQESTKQKKKINLTLIYSLILRQFYQFNYSPAAESLIHSRIDDETGLPKYYRLNVDTRFVDIQLKGPLPVLHQETLSARLLDADGLDFLKDQLPLSLFRFEGLSAITVTDITREQAVENIKNIILDRTDCRRDSYYDEIISALRTLTGEPSIEFGLMPVVKINGQPVFSRETSKHSILGMSCIESGEPEDTYLNLIRQYILEPKLLFYERLPEPSENGNAFFRILRSSGTRSYGVIPVFYNNHLAGILEVYSKKADVLTHEILSRLDIAVPMLAQLLQRTIDEIDAKIKALIKENYTSIQPAVEWKFNEAAWQFLQQRCDEEHRPALQTIYFKNVYPLYGAIDVRNSTFERNAAVRRDLQIQFGVLEETLTELQGSVHLELLDELNFRCKRWRRMLEGNLTTADELELNSFLKNEIGDFFCHFGEGRPAEALIIKKYFDATNESTGCAFANRRELESSLQLINKTIGRHLESSMTTLQQSYPSYFEKFRTDGVEYDIYVGQSITPGIPFDLLYLKNLRLWQLSSMASIARQTHVLLPELPAKLQTTQLIFVHSNPIDISFRKDERRFDVEGGYNIRYQMVKKRIDKVHTLGGSERLTQPGKIAVIYFNDKEMEEYAGYISYLQEKGVLEDDLETLELEELQGVTGLKAFRVGVNLNP